MDTPNDHPKYYHVHVTLKLFIVLVIHNHGVQRKMISVDNFFVLFLRLLFYAVLLLYVT